jgi:hypothetical protein
VKRRVSVLSYRWCGGVGGRRGSDELCSSGFSASIGSRWRERSPLWSQHCRRASKSSEKSMHRCALIVARCSLLAAGCGCSLLPAATPSCSHPSELCYCSHTPHSLSTVSAKSIRGAGRAAVSIQPTSPHRISANPPITSFRLRSPASAWDD